MNPCRNLKGTMSNNKQSMTPNQKAREMARKAADKVMQKCIPTHKQGADVRVYITDLILSTIPLEELVECGQAVNRFNDWLGMPQDLHQEQITAEFEKVADAQIKALSKLQQKESK